MLGHYLGVFSFLFIIFIFFPGVLFLSTPFVLAWWLYKEVISILIDQFKEKYKED